MRLSWNEVRARAAKFAKDWRDASYEKGETQSFYNDFFRVFGTRAYRSSRAFRFSPLPDYVKPRTQVGSDFFTGALLHDAETSINRTFPDC